MNIRVATVLASLLLCLLATFSYTSIPMLTVQGMPDAYELIDVEAAVGPWRTTQTKSTSSTRTTISSLKTASRATMTPVPAGEDYDDVVLDSTRLVGPPPGPRSHAPVGGRVQSVTMPSVTFLIYSVSSLLYRFLALSYNS